MKLLKIGLILLGLLTSAGFVEGQTAMTNNRIFLEPNQKKDSIQIETSCLILLRNYTVNLPVPLGRTYQMILPEGTRYLVEKGTYQLENPMKTSLEFELVPADECRK